MTLNDFEWRNSPYFVFLTEFDNFASDYITDIDRPIISVKCCLQIPVFHFWPKVTHPAARSLCDSWSSCWCSPGYV